MGYALVFGKGTHKMLHDDDDDGDNDGDDGDDGDA